ncbi:Protein of unknown function, partial [Gryllus bimaculatus]
MENRPAANTTAAPVSTSSTVALCGPNPTEEAVVQMENFKMRWYSIARSETVNREEVISTWYVYEYVSVYTREEINSIELMKQFWKTLQASSRNIDR